MLACDLCGLFEVAEHREENGAHEQRAWLGRLGEERVDYSHRLVRWGRADEKRGLNSEEIAPALIRAPGVAERVLARLRHLVEAAVEARDLSERPPDTDEAVLVVRLLEQR